MGKNAVPLMKTMEDLGQAALLLPFVFGEDNTYKKGSHKGQNKFLTKLGSAIPIVNQGISLGRITSKNILEEQR